jgi:DNA-damage-inducible protein D
MVGVDDELRQVLVSPFDSICHSDETQSDPELQEYWLARELQSLLGYETWENFEKAICRAAESLDTYGLSRGYHFRGFTKMVPTGKDAMREVTDCRNCIHSYLVM